jgi:hypothetical protein
MPFVTSQLNRYRSAWSAPLSVVLMTNANMVFIHGGETYTSFAQKVCLDAFGWVTPKWRHAKLVEFPFIQRGKFQMSRLEFAAMEIEADPTYLDLTREVAELTGATALRLSSAEETHSQRT